MVFQCEYDASQTHLNQNTMRFIHFQKFCEIFAIMVTDVFRFFLCFLLEIWLQYSPSQQYEIICQQSNNAGTAFSAIHMDHHQQPQFKLLA